MPETTVLNSLIVRRLLGIGLLLTCLAGALCWLFAGFRQAISCLIGGGLAAGSMVWLGQTVSAALVSSPTASKYRPLAGYVLRLMLIPLCLYVMLRLHFFSLLAAVAGLAAFNAAVLIVGIFEAVGSRSGSNARAERNRSSI